MSLPVFVRKTEGSSVNTTLTLNIQSSGTDRVFVLGLAYKSNSVLAPTSIVFNGTENFTLERSAADGGDAQCLLYYLTAPSEVTADVVITMPGAVRMVGYVALFTNAHQTEPFTGNTSEAQGTNNAPTVDVSSAADEMCVDILVQVSAGPDTATATHTEICNGAAVGGGTDCRGAGQYAVGQATRTMNWAMSDADNWNIIAGALREPTGGVTVSPSPVSAISTALIGAILLGSTVASPSPAVAIGERVNPTVVLGSTSVVPNPAESIATTVNPIVILGNSLVSPNPASAVSSVVDPTVIIGGGGISVTPTPVSAISSTINPTVVLGSTSVVPSPASSVASSVNPTVILGSLTIIPNPASAIATTVDPTVIKGSLIIIPTPASSIGATVDPTVIISTPAVPKLITGVMSESLHIKGIMSKEFSAIRCLDFNGSTDYVDCGKDISLNIIDAMTIEVWIKPISVTLHHLIIDNRFKYNEEGIRLGYITAKFRGYWQDTVNGIQYISVDSEPSLNQLSHIIFVLNDEGKAKLCINNIVQSDIKNFNGIVRTGIKEYTYIGRQIPYYFNGKIYKARIWNRALSPEERTNCYNGNIPRNGLVAEWLMREQQGNILHDTSINSNHGTIHGANWHEEKFNTPLKGIMSNSSEITGIMTAEYI